VSDELVPQKVWQKPRLCSCHYNVATIPWKNKTKGEQWDHCKGDELTILHSHLHLHTQH
jgi:hypothetical protein